MSEQRSNQIRAWRELMHVHASVTAALDQRLRSEVGIPGSWYEALVEIALAGGTMRMNQFAAETTLTKSGASRFVDRLEKAGLVQRRMCATDRRVWQLSLTPEGKRVQKSADPHVLDVIDEHFGAYLDTDEALVMFETLRRMRPAPVPA
ncbi:MAG: MarR family winged helix-turn-helix transcriptional regulator [Acidimicrobiia bacterium]